MAAAQTYKNHARFHPLFHFVLAPVFLLNVIACAVHVYRVRTHWSVWELVISVALVGVLVLIRTNSLRVQDRVIRLEENLRLAALGGVALQSRLGELTVPQLIALRFASDAEVVPLAIRALDQKLTPKQIKESIQSWRGDYLRV